MAGGGWEAGRRGLWGRGWGLRRVVWLLGGPWGAVTLCLWCHLVQVKLDTGSARGILPVHFTLRWP